MTVIEYINRKNTILFNKTGIQLIPDDQIVECKQVRLTKTTFASDMCPYCKVYIDCMECPMKLAGNQCGTVTDTWSIMLRIYEGLATNSFVDDIELVELVDQYNRELPND